MRIQTTFGGDHPPTGTGSTWILGQHEAEFRAGALATHMHRKHGPGAGAQVLLLPVPGGGGGRPGRNRGCFRRAGWEVAWGFINIPLAPE